MVLFTHAIAGAAAATAVSSNPVVGFCAGFASHFVLDAIPHWHYNLRAYTRDAHDPMKNAVAFDARLIHDFMVTGIDCAVGFALAFLTARAASPSLVVTAMYGAAGGVLPDLLQLAYYAFPKSPLKYLQRFHHAVHAKRRLDNDLLLGLGSQVALAVALVSLAPLLAIIR